MIESHLYIEGLQTAQAVNSSSNATNGGNPAEFGRDANQFLLVNVSVIRKECVHWNTLEVLSGVSKRNCSCRDD